MARKNREQVNKAKIAFGVAVEIVIMAIEILCCLLPMPWRLVVPIIIGARAIIVKAVKYVKSPPTMPIVYCNGVQEKAHTTRKRTESKSYGGEKVKQAAGKRGDK